MKRVPDYFFKCISSSACQQQQQQQQQQCLSWLYQFWKSVLTISSRVSCFLYNFFPGPHSFLTPSWSWWQSWGRPGSDCGRDNFILCYFILLKIPDVLAFYCIVILHFWIKETLNLSTCSDSIIDTKKILTALHCIILHCTALHCTALRCQKTFCKLVLQDKYVSYKNALAPLKLQTLKERRKILSLRFIERSLADDNLHDLFPKRKKRSTILLQEKIKSTESNMQGLSDLKNHQFWPCIEPLTRQYKNRIKLYGDL